VTQSIYILLHREWRNPLWRWGAVVVLYFSCISFLSWESHFTITRHALPMTLVFNLLLALRPTKAWLIWFLLGNCFVPFGVRYFDQMAVKASPAAPVEFVVEAAPGAPAVTVRYGEGWSEQLWWPDKTWRWAQAGTATLVLTNPGAAPARAELRGLLQSFHLRDFRVEAGGRTLWTGGLPIGRRVLAFGPIELPPGETKVTFTASGAPSKAGQDDTTSDVMFKLEGPELRVRAR